MTLAALLGFQASHALRRLVTVGPHDPVRGGTSPRRALLGTSCLLDAGLAASVALALGMNAPGPVTRVAAIGQHPLNDGSRPAQTAARAGHAAAIEFLRD